MYLKRLELLGFKSFSEKTRLEFTRGITAVVGPNGSGKSNIADAVRWVLGEQSAKTLRGQKMEDVIFAGTENRRALGFAEVSLTIDNADGKMPVEFSEIKVTRRVYRSGESDYQINGVSCRLKDIHEMFMDTGVGREGYSIIGQGRIEEILSSRSEDRRFLFEEAAGIVKFKNRKQEAEAKLARERQNLVRVNDIISMLEEQLNPLAAQAEKAKAYLEAKERLKVLQVNLFLTDSEKMEAELASVTKNLDDLAAQMEAETINRRKLEAAAADLLRQSEEADRKNKETAAALADLRSQTEQKENDIRLAREQMRAISENSARLADEATRKLSQTDALLTMLSVESGKTDQILAELSGKKALLSESLEKFSRLSEKMSEMERRIEGYNAAIIAKIKEAGAAKSVADTADLRYKALEARKEAINDEKSMTQSSLMETRARLAAVEKSLADLDAETAKIQHEQKFLEADKARTAAAIAEAAKAHTEVAKALSDAVTRHRVLSDLEKSYEGYNKSVKAVLLQKRQEPTVFSGVFGAVGELLETEKAYETAIEVALGASVQNIVTATEDDAKMAIEFLKRTNSGRATFLPLTAMSHKTMNRPSANILNEPGVIGAAIDLVRAEDRFAPALLSLLGRVIVMDNLERAISVYKKYGYSYKIVTTGGELLSPGGAMTGGSLNHKTASVFGRAREVKGLEKLVAKLEADVTALEAGLQQENTQLRIMKDKLGENNGRLQERALARVTLSENLSQAEGKMAALSERAEQLNKEDQTLIADILAANHALREAERIQIELESAAAALQQELADFQTAALSDKQEKEGSLQALTDLKVAISALEQNAGSSGREKARLEGEVAQNRRKIETLRREIAEDELKLAEKRRLIESFEADIAALSEEQREKGALLARLDDEKEDILEKLKKAEAEAEAIKTALFRLENEKVRLDMKREQSDADRRKIFDDMWDEYGLTAQSALAYKLEDASYDKMKREERNVRWQIQDMGDVNVGAIEEYKQVRARFEEMSVQRNDILETEEKLNMLIGQLVTLMEAQFKEQFAIISENFNTVFKEMFSGGKAHLQLADEGNVLNSGIDIIAQPPGKKLQSMSLLSGGERALTATALLFAILLLKPSPFCILDEVEAALDDANVVRYAEFLKKFGNDTQFILITHRKGTMEAADTLYGVTMQEQGISALVSVNLVEEQAM